MPCDKKKKIKKLSELFDMNTYEVSLVPFGANEKKSFLITKNNGELEMDKATLALILKGNVENEDKLKEIAKSLKLDEKAESGLVAIMKLASGTGLDTAGLTQVLKSLNGEKSEVEIKKELETSLREELTTEIKKQLETKENNVDGGSEVSGFVPVQKDDGTFDLTKIEKSEGQEGLIAIMKAHNATVLVNKSLAEKLKDQEEKALMTEFVAVAKSYGKEGDEGKATVQIMKALHDAGKTEELEAYKLTLKSHNDQMLTSNLFKEHGTSTSTFGMGAMTKIEKKAETMMREKPELTQEQAQSLVIKNHPELYAEYEAETRKQHKELY